jgi:hypothetical protein
VLCSVEGINVLQDTTTDTPFVRGLGLGFEVNGLLFSQSGSGIQKSGPELTRRVQRDARGRAVAEIEHLVYWVPTAQTPASPDSAWLVEQRRLQFVVDESARETAVRWHSDFEVGPAVESARLVAPSGSGLTARLLPDFAPFGSAQVDGLNGRAGEGPAGEGVRSWCALQARVAGRPLTVALFGESVPAVEGAFHAQSEPFALLWARPGWAEQPWVGRPGDRCSFRALVVVQTREATDTSLQQRAELWLHEAAP